jgi:lysozyme
MNMQWAQGNGRVLISSLTLSAAALVGLVTHEGYTDKAVQPLKGDKWTHGFGSTTKEDGSPVQQGDSTTPVRALGQALRDVQRFEGALRGCVRVPLYQHEYDIYVRFAYNVGAQAFCGSTLVKKLNAQDYAGACAEISRWTFYKGLDCRDHANKCAGLVIRREQERALCEGRK